MRITVADAHIELALECLGFDSSNMADGLQRPTETATNEVSMYI